MAQMRQQPTPAEIYGEFAGAMRGVVDDAHFAAVFGPINGLA